MSGAAGLNDQAEAIQRAMIRVLDTHAKTVRICAMSKRWWNEDIGLGRSWPGKARKKWQKEKDAENW